MDQIDGMEHAGLIAIVDQRGCERDGDVGFARACSAHQNEGMCRCGELACAERFGLGQGDGGGAIIDGGEVLVIGVLRDAHDIGWSAPAALQFRRRSAALSLFSNLVACVRRAKSEAQAASPCRLRAVSWSMRTFTQPLPQSSIAS